MAAPNNLNAPCARADTATISPLVTVTVEDTPAVRDQEGLVDPDSEQLEGAPAATPQATGSQWASKLQAAPEPVREIAEADRDLLEFGERSLAWVLPNFGDGVQLSRKWSLIIDIFLYLIPVGWSIMSLFNRLSTIAYFDGCVNVTAAAAAAASDSESSSNSESAATGGSQPLPWLNYTSCLACNNGKPFLSTAGRANAPGFDILMVGAVLLIIFELLYLRAWALRKVVFRMLAHGVHVKFGFHLSSWRSILNLTLVTGMLWFFCRQVVMVRRVVYANLYLGTRAQWGVLETCGANMTGSLRAVFHPFNPAHVAEGAAAPCAMARTCSLRVNARRLLTPAVNRDGCAL